MHLRVGPEATQAEAKRGPAHETLRQLHLGPLGVVFVHDLEPGADMANAVGVGAAPSQGEQKLIMQDAARLTAINRGSQARC